MFWKGGKKPRLVLHLEFKFNLFLVFQGDLFVIWLERVLDVQEKVEENKVLHYGSGLSRARIDSFTCRQDTSVLHCNVAYPTPAGNQLEQLFQTGKLKTHNSLQEKMFFSSKVHLCPVTT